ncbi:MAG: cupin domain-containing protein [Bacteroidia bacterium]|nr:cupin domain-containing protein [Bacteroidia bacterium]NNJ55812.1 cupin domain-containing protein [Bacteroidia bacterium]
MQRILIILYTVSITLFAHAQQVKSKKIQPDSTSFENIYVTKIAEDELQSTFVIWIKKEVKPHYHAHHTEYVQVLSGKGTMVLNKDTFKIKKGDSMVIPKGSIHSVRTTSRKPLKVVSVQAPKYDGDRIWID